MKDSEEEFVNRLKTLMPRDISTECKEEIIRATEGGSPLRPTFRLWVGAAVAATILLMATLYHTENNNTGRLEVGPGKPFNITSNTGSTIRNRGVAMEKVYMQWPGKVVMENSKPMREIHRIWVRYNELKIPGNNSVIRWRQPRHEVVLVAYQTM